MPVDAISALLERPSEVAECRDVAEWWPRWRALAALTTDPFERAVRGGARADRVGWAFASGYQAALRALDPTIPDDIMAAFCVTEADGNFPRAIRTTLTPEGEGFSINGEKRWTTLGPGGALLVVIARKAGTSEARPSLRGVRIASGTPGLRIETMPPTSFVPEVPHARIHLDGVKVAASAVLDGDAYVRFVKPFRTIEDIHVHAASISYLVSEARRRNWPAAWIERSAALLHSLGRLATLDPLASATHAALSGALALGEELIRGADGFWLQSGDDPAAARWARDRRLFEVASKARNLRAKAAWARLDETG